MVSEEFNSVNIWLRCNRLALNIEKSSYMVFSHDETFLNTNINNIVLQKAQNITFLGVHYDHKLSFKFHYEEGLSTVSRVAGTH